MLPLAREELKTMKGKNYGYFDVTANLWDTPAAQDLAREIANISGLYCGPAVVGWIAAVWNRNKGRAYDYATRLRNKSLFPDGPRRASGSAPGFQSSVDTILRRETQGELRLSVATYHQYGALHDQLEAYDRPIIICMFHDDFWDGMHYTALYKSQKETRRLKLDRIKFSWMDNGVYGRRDGGNPGIYADGWRNVGQSFFVGGAKRIVGG